MPGRRNWKKKLEKTRRLRQRVRRIKQNRKRIARKQNFLPFSCRDLTQLVVITSESWSLREPHERVKRQQVLFEKIILWQHPQEVPGTWEKVVVCAFDKILSAWTIAHFDQGRDFVCALPLFVKPRWVTREIRYWKNKHGYRQVPNASDFARCYGIPLNEPLNVQEEDQDAAILL